jgi:hypothetical protein
VVAPTGTEMVGADEVFRPPNNPPPVVGGALFSLLLPASSFFGPKLKPPGVPPNDEGAAAGLNIPGPEVADVDAGVPKSPPAGAFPVLLPKSDGAAAPEVAAPDPNVGAVVLAPPDPKRPVDAG